MIQTILENQAKSDRRLDAIKEEILGLSSKTDRLTEILEVFQEMKAKIDFLETALRDHAHRLTELENRSRRNNLLVFGVEEQTKESEADLKKAVVDDIFEKELGVKVK